MELSLDVKYAESHYVKMVSHMYCPFISDMMANSFISIQLMMVKKIEIIKQNNRVGFEFDIFHEIIKAETPCKWGTRYESVVGTGIAEFIDSQQEKAKALECILSQYGASFNEFKDSSLSSVTIIRVSIVSISGKEKL